MNCEATIAQDTRIRHSNIGIGASCSATTGAITVSTLAGTLQKPKTVLLSMVGIKLTAERYTKLKAALIPNLAIVIYNGIIETSFGKIKSRKAPTMDKVYIPVNDFLAPKVKNRRTLTIADENSASCDTTVFSVMVPFTFFI